MWETCKTGLARYNLWDDRTALKLLSGLLFPRRTPSKNAQRIVVYRVGNIGDTVVNIPALTALREAFPDAHITLLTSAGQADLPGAEAVLSAFPGLVNHVIAYFPNDVKSLSGLQRLKSQLTESGPIDLWISLPVSLQTVFRGFREVLLARWLGSKNAFGFTLLLPEFFKTEYARAHDLPKTSDWLLSIVQNGLGLSQPEPDCIAYFQPPVPDILQRLNLSKTHPILAVNAGAKLAVKRWPSALFRETLSLVLKDIPNLQIVLLGNQAERELNVTIAENLPGRIINAAGQLNLGETWSLLNEVNAVLSNDTGVMHMAGLLGKKVFTPMGGQYPAPLWHPRGKELEIFSNAVACAPCFKDACLLPEQTCLTGISPKLAAEAICAYLRQHNASH